ncbi:tripartite ATP-independent transporter DctM subunit [Halanaerobium saccharolyticum]|uniref:Tripartite ATP-independent transporter DctM subunit n=1 Tax=Halanaerobium saccharolyticum TaxID=43595 RepID=A0A4R7YWJ9_9FIRM|nr:TRAP transporter large permease [Halanaerobium saccharolyticum]RAK06950.1 tripartite ATP-independent transporter DctM subunit [Halanaerobium saccharolyticum]TDW01677.1 tripartite ATP-independent transporter DctM subunit [Halanaerobium saccharolyticum]TDX53075.1 tripartite ATP-independent transporter DctM subunit [Halanaerobium saccharolyticum]
MGSAAIILLFSFLIQLGIGIPISISIGMSTLITALTTLPVDIVFFSIAQKMIGGIDSFSLLAVPLFVFAGNVMNNGGIAKKLIDFAKVIGGRLPGALAHANVLGNMLFGSLSGSAVAAAAAIGGTMGPIQEEEGYDPSYAAAVNIASSPTGMLIPPSGVLILYSLVAGGVSISALFVAGYIPGILMGLSCMLVAYVYAKKNNYPVAEKVTFREGFKVFLKAIPSLLLIIIVIGGIVAGIFTATEGAAMAVVYTIFLSYVYGTLSIKSFKDIVLKTAVTTGVIMFLVASSSAMSWIMAYTGIPQAISNAILSVSDNQIIILLIMNITLLIVGTFMDLTPAVLIFTPIFLPIAKQLGLHPVHFGILLVFNLCIGITTPPVGSVLFVGCSVAGISIEKVIKPMIPFFAVLIIALLIVTFIPEISLFLPRLFGLL